MTPHRNRGLFSNYYLNELLPKEEEFNLPISEVMSVFEKIKAIWDKSRFEAINEDQLRKHFLDKALDYLGWTVDVNAPVPTGEWSKRPDYALFQSEDSLKTAQKGKKEDYFNKAICIAEAKRWGRHLDKKIKTEADPLEIQNPSLQISRYLWLTGVKWGILMDGRFWRLYERETSKRLDIFYEIDLEDLIESGSTEDFRYFYFIFGKDAFPEFIEKVYKGSIDYAEAVGEELKENIYQALKTMAQGFLKTPGNNLSEAYLKEIHDSSLILLYRLLFILYAEYRGLLPLGVNKFYTESYSLDGYKKEIANRIDQNEPLATSTFGYWNKLKELFEIINIGNKELGVPPYNGGLFESEKHKFLETHRVGDFYVAKAIDLLSRSKDKAYIDYGSLEIRHLGSIYEGLLEYKLKIADQDLIPMKDKGKEVFIPVAEAKKQKKIIRENERIHLGEIYLVTDKGERKATGSYYTPDYIVKYIIENTLGPLLEEKRENISKRITELKEKIKESRGVNRELYEKELKKAEGSLIDEILSLKVLDPAMGSGHFLVEATDFLARELLKALSGESLDEHSKEMAIREISELYTLKEPEEDIRWARREVVEKCIFGVDLNPLAVELAKLSLWLYTVAKNRPLNFLDHHLRCGNSLIGAKIDDFAALPELKEKRTEWGAVQLGLFESIFREKVNILLGAFAQIEMLPSDTVEQIRGKEKLYQDFRKIVSRFQDVADVWTSIHFGNKVDFGDYQKLQDNLRSTEDEWGKLNHEIWFKKAKEISYEKRLFNWELEFPEVFFEGYERKENPGFDAVVGNPPYVNFANLPAIERAYYQQNFRCTRNKSDIYALFIEKSINYFLKKGCYHGFIISNTWLSTDSFIPLRELLFKNIKKLSLLPQPLGTFERATVEPIILTFHYSPKVNGAGIINIYSSDNLSNAKHSLDISTFTNPPNYLFSIIDVNNRKIILKIDSNSYHLGSFVKFVRGIKTADNNRFILLYKKDESCFPLLRGKDIDRYYTEYQELWIWYRPELMRKKAGAVPQQKKNFEISEKIILQGRSGARLIATLDINQFYTIDTTYISIIKNKLLSLHFILALLNSKLINFWYSSQYRTSTISGYELDNIPIRKISFTTFINERQAKADKFKLLFINYLRSNNKGKTLDLIDEFFEKKYKPDLKLIKAHNSDPINKDSQILKGALWEQSDVVHDILAYLAERMIEMNKEKQQEIRGFLKWLESQLKIQSDAEGNTGIDVLTGKTQIRNYLGDYQKGEERLPFEEFWKILEKNKNRIQANIKSRELYDNVRLEYDKSLSKLLLLKENLRKTDWLIDQIVYKLYGLTEEEIRTVENTKIK